MCLDDDVLNEVEPYATAAARVLGLLFVNTPKFIYLSEREIPVHPSVAWLHVTHYLPHPHVGRRPVLKLD